MSRRTSPCFRLATQRIEALNQRHGGERFFLFHRERRWCDSEQKFIGWERKRGKLEELNGLIDGTRPPEAERLVHVGNPDQLVERHGSSSPWTATRNCRTTPPAG